MLKQLWELGQIIAKAQDIRQGAEELSVGVNRALDEESRIGGRRPAATMSEGDAERLRRRLDKLTLITMAMWSFLSEKTGTTEEQLMERVKKIDLMDGVADGKLNRTVAKCAACARVMSPRHTKCLYCGAEKLKITAFDEVV